MGRYYIISIGMILISLIPMIAALGKITSQPIHRMSCRKEATFKANGTGFTVKASSSKLIATANVPLLPHCARRCVNTGNCKSLVYKKQPVVVTDINCQILKVEKMNLTNDDIEHSVGWIYFVPLQQAGKFSYFKN